MIDGRIGSATVSEKTREQSPFQTKTMSNASNTLEEEEEEEASESMPGGNANGGVAAGGAKKKAIRCARIGPSPCEKVSHGASRRIPCVDAWNTGNVTSC